MKRILSMLALMLAFWTMTTSAWAQIASGTNGRNATHAKAGNLALAQMPAAAGQKKPWNVSSASSANSVVYETQRDDWTVYFDNGGSLNLFQKVLNGFSQDALTVTAADAVVDGQNMGGVDFSAGGFRFMGSGQWGDLSGNFYNEAGRDPWSVYLDNRATGKRVQLDLYKKQIIVPGTSSLIPVTNSSVVASGPALSTAPTNPGTTVPQSDISSAALNRAVGWISSEVQILSTPMCYRSSYDRGIGIAPSCPDGQMNVGGLCYDNCRSGYSSKGTSICGTDCPGGYTDTGAFCHFNGTASYSPVRWDKCKSKFLGGCVGGSVEDDCRDGYKKTASMCYYTHVPSGMSGSPGDPMKGTYTAASRRSPDDCKSNRVMQAGLCYVTPQNGYTCNVTGCQQQCAKGTSDCGPAACANSAQSCGQGITNMVMGPVQMIAFIDTMGAAAAANVAIKASLTSVNTAISAGSALTSYASILQGAVQNYMAFAEGNLAAITSTDIDNAVAAKWGRGTPNYRTIARSWANVLIQLQMIQAGIDTLNLITSTVDPTGVVSTIQAYANPKCASHTAIPSY